MATSNAKLTIYLIIAILFGILVTTIFFFLMYSQRWLVYRNCPRQIRTCAGDDYLEDPQSAADAGHDVDQLLVVRNGVLTYRRPIRNTDCRPSSEPVTVDYPMYCLLDGEVYRNRMPGHSSYISPSGTVHRFDKHCRLDGRQGEPQARWQ